ncbi:type II toxin-antitoxin system HicB family antitoxin, partial [Escherichia coli]
LSGAHSLDDIHDEGYLAYSDNINYSHCDSWFVIDVDLSEVEGKQQRINISLPDILIRRIDGYVKESGGVYKDRSHFLAQAARHELTYK